MTLDPEEYARWELRRAALDGLIAPAPQISAAAAEAVRMFPNQGVSGLAALMASVHARGLDYLKQAPVLVLLASRGKKHRTKADRLYIATRFGSLCHRGPKLRDALAEYGAPLPLRKLLPFALTPTRFAAVEVLCRVGASPLSQAIPAKPGAQATWLRAIVEWIDHLRRRRLDPRTMTEWFAVESGRALPVMPAGWARAVTDVADFAAAPGTAFNMRWTLPQAKAAAERWHAELAKLDAEAGFLKTHGIGWEDEIDYGKLPTESRIGGLTFLALRSGATLYAEGRAMRHCVGAYSRSVVAGHSRIYSLRQGDTRIATLELQPSKGRFEPVQLKGPCNAVVPAVVRDAAYQFVARLNNA